MEGIEGKPDKGTVQKYLALVSMIDNIQNRLKWSEFVYILLNLVVFFATINFLAYNFERVGAPKNYIFVFFIALAHVIGLFINTYWAAASSRSYLKLKLRYFQARFLERKLDGSGEFIFSDEEPFFNPEIGAVESPDGKETVTYPSKGLLRMDGCVGTANPRVLSLAVPFIFFIIYLMSLIFFIALLFR